MMAPARHSGTLLDEKSHGRVGETLKRMDTEGIDPSTFRMQSGRSTTDLSAQILGTSLLLYYRTIKTKAYRDTTLRHTTTASKEQLFASRGS
jgi:hypothetical protein